MLLDVAIEAARAGGQILRSYWRKLPSGSVAEKSRNDFVSRADRESEAAIFERIRSRFPEDAFLGEETGWTAQGARRSWIVDPLDGTSNFVSGFPFWSVSIAVREEEEIVAGVVWDPLREELYSAQKGGGAFRNGQRLRVSTRETLEGAFLATGYPFRARDAIDAYLALFRAYFLKSRGVRRAGSAALDLAHVASGVFDGFFEFRLSPWDIAAGEVLIREAGGLVTDLAGGRDFWERGNILAGAPSVVREMAEIARALVRTEDI